MPGHQPLRLLGALVLSLPALPGAWAAEVPREARQSAAAPQEASAAQSLPEEIVVTGRDIAELRQALSDAEDHMYATYNALNDEDLYDIHCQWEAPLGTRFENKVCRPTYQMQAESQAGKDFLQGSFLTPPVMAVIKQHQPLLEERMKRLIQEHPELYEAVVEHHVLREALEESRRRHLAD